MVKSTRRETLTYYLIPIVVVFSILAVVWGVVGVWPLGDRTVATVDLSSQYTGLYAYLGDVLNGKEGLFYSFNKGIGGEMYAIWTYYLTSPFNIIFKYINGANVLQGIQIVFLLKLLAMVLTSTYYFKKKGVPLLLTITFVVGWVFSNYFMMNRIHLMWIDGFILLPLVILSLERGLTTNRYGWYTLLLTITIITNYYTGYMIGVFTVLYTLYLYLTKEDGQKVYIAGYVKHCIYSGLLAAFILLPSAVQLLGGMKDKDWSELLNWYKLEDVLFNLRWFTPFTYEFTHNGPLVFFGTANILYSLLILQKLPKKQRRAYLTIISLFIASMVFKPLNRLWHIGQDETWYNFRYMFTFIWFNLIHLAKHYKYLDYELKVKDTILPTLYLILTSIPLLLLFTRSEIEIVVWFILIISIVYGVAVLLPFNYRVWVLLPLLVIEVGALTFTTEFASNGKTVSEYTETYMANKEDIGYQDDTGRGYFDGGVSHVNNGLKYNKPLLGHTSSSIGESTKKLFKQLGLLLNYSHTGYQTLTIFAQTLLNVGTVYTDDISYISQEGNYTTSKQKGVYYMPYRLGWGYTIKELVTSELDESSLNINDVTKGLLGKEYMVEVEPHLLEREAEQVGLLDDNKYRVEEGYDEEQSVSVTYKLPEGVNYVYYNRYYLDEDKTGPFEETVKYGLTEKRHEGDIMAGAVLLPIKEGVDTITYNLEPTPSQPYSKDSEGMPLPKFYKVKDEEYMQDIRNYFNNHNQFELESQENGRVTGTINNTSGQRYLQFVIPHQQGWFATVNGVETSIHSSMNLLAVEIPEGESHITLTYTPPLLKEGLMVSLLTLGVVILDSWFTGKRRKVKQSTH